MLFVYGGMHPEATARLSLHSSVIEYVLATDEVGGSIPSAEAFFCTHKAKTLFTARNTNDLYETACIHCRKKP